MQVSDDIGPPISIANHTNSYHVPSTICGEWLNGILLRFRTQNLHPVRLNRALTAPESCEMLETAWISLEEISPGRRNYQYIGVS